MYFEQIKPENFLQQQELRQDQRQDQRQEHHLEQWQTDQIREIERRNEYNANDCNTLRQFGFNDDEINRRDWQRYSWHNGKWMECGGILNFSNSRGLHK